MQCLHRWQKVLNPELVKVGPAGHRSTRHRVPFKARDEGSKCVG